jgi:hypothetical protein
MYRANLRIEYHYCFVDVHTELAEFHTLGASITTDHALRFVNYTAGGAVIAKPTESLGI